MKLNYGPLFQVSKFSFSSPLCIHNYSFPRFSLSLSLFCGLLDTLWDGEVSLSAAHLYLFLPPGSFKLVSPGLGASSMVDFTFWSTTGVIAVFFPITLRIRIFVLNRSSRNQAFYRVWKSRVNFGSVELNNPNLRIVTVLHIVTTFPPREQPPEEPWDCTAQPFPGHSVEWDAVLDWDTQWVIG